MPRRPSAPRVKAAEKLKRNVQLAKQGLRPKDSAPFPNKRNDLLVDLCDLCASAQLIAEAEGEKLLAYLLAMAIQEGQTALRRRITAQADVPVRPTRPPA